MVNVLDQLPKKKQLAARAWLRTMMYAEDRADAVRARDRFVKQYRTAHPKATETLLRDSDWMVTFFEYSLEHWRHLRTTNIVESPFASVPRA
jgi:putative transposase